MKKKLKLKKFVLPSVYLATILTVVITIYLSTRTYSLPPEENITYVSNAIFQREVPVINLETIIGRPYQDNDITVAKYYYNYTDEQSKQENSIINYHNNYMPNTGIDYIREEAFDVISILDGIVIDVSEDEIMGYTVQVRHENDLISVYQSLNNVMVKEEDVINQGSVIAKSGANNLQPTLGNHLHFELFYQGQVVNPDNFLNKKLGELSQ